MHIGLLVINEYPYIAFRYISQIYYTLINIAIHSHHEQTRCILNQMFAYLLQFKLKTWNKPCLFCRFMLMIKYIVFVYRCQVRRKGRKVFVGAMKNFKSILMGHEWVIFLKIYNGLQKVLLCPHSVIIIFKLSGSEQVMSKLPIKEIKKI